MRMHTRGELVRRWMRRNARVLTVIAAATVVLAGFGAYAIDRVIDERDAAESQRAVAESERAESDALAVTLLAEQGPSRTRPKSMSRAARASPSR